MPFGPTVARYRPGVICQEDAGATAKFENNPMFISEPNGAKQ
jgi:hypothetical protein